MPDEASKVIDRRVVPTGDRRVQTAERRRAVRYPFTATAELIELEGGTRMKARTSDLSSSGCYIDAMSPFPAGTQVRIRLSQGKQVFEALGNVPFSNPGMGMGVTFTEMEEDQKCVLDKWIGGLSGDLKPVFEDCDPEVMLSFASQGERQALNLLINLLMKKGTIATSEAAEILRALYK